MGSRGPWRRFSRLYWGTRRTHYQKIESEIAPSVTYYEIELTGDTVLELTGDSVIEI